LGSACGGSAPPPLPTFSASATLHPLRLAEMQGEVAQPYFHDVTLRHDAATGRIEWRVVYNQFVYVSAKYADLFSRQVCEAGKCHVESKNGTGCYEGTLSNLGALMELWWVALPRSGVKTGRGAWFVADPAVGNMTLHLSDDGVPRAMLVEPTIAYVGRSNVFSYSWNVTFGDVRVGSASDAARIEGISCPQSERKACPRGPVQRMQVLRASNGEPWGRFDDRDLFNWLGQAVTLGAPGHFAFMNTKFLEVGDVEVNTTYGPWRDCNWDPVHKVEKCTEVPKDFEHLVSRSSAEQLTGPANAPGQCGPHDLVGSWFVLPHQGECGEGQTVGDGGCTWKLRKFKVVEMDCLRGDAFSQAWRADWQRPPFAAATRVLKEAVRACPDVGHQPPPKAEVKVLLRSFYR